MQSCDATDPTPVTFSWRLSNDRLTRARLASPVPSIYLISFPSRTRFSIIIVRPWSGKVKYTEGGRPEAQWQGPLEAVYLGPLGLVPPLLVVSLYLPSSSPVTPPVTWLSMAILSPDPGKKHPGIHKRSINEITLRGPISREGPLSSRLGRLCR